CECRYPRGSLMERRNSSEHGAGSAPAAAVPDDLEGSFRRLAAAWRTERGHTSSLSRMTACPAYQQIIGLGPAVVPLLLRELERDPDYWFAALHALTAADPVAESSRGKLREMAAAWVRWGREQG